mgnify:CR=1 FL=1
MDFNLKGRTAFITGASRGIGKAIAVALAAEGANLGLFGRDLERCEQVAKELGFDGVCANSLDAVSDRDFAIEFTSAAALCMLHISRLSEELIVWMSQNFGFIQLPDRFTTGSSIMPQKKNPDVPELARGKTGRVVGHLMGLITLMKAQPLAYNKDNQEDKEPLFDTVDTLKDTLRIFAEMIGGQTASDGSKQGGISVNPQAIGAASGMYGFAQMSYGMLCTIVIESWSPGAVRRTQSARPRAISVLPTPVGPTIRMFLGSTSSRRPSGSCWRRQRLRSATATARLASCWPTMCLSSSETISRGEKSLLIRASR